VAELAAAGRTNREIAQTLFLSVHTVEDNLRRVYGKLGIRSRTELAAKSRTLLASGFRPGLAKCDLLIRKVPLTWEDGACLESCPSRAEGTFQVNNSARAARVLVSADGRGLVSQAGAVLLWETMRVTGLARGLSDGLDR
jgi:hypothetical protein